MMMKTLKRCLLAIPFLLLAAPAHADYRPGDFGLGIGSGTMTRLGLSFKHFMGDNAVQANFGCHGWSCDGIGLSGEYLFEMPALAEGRVMSLAWNAGLGPGIGVYSSNFALAGAGVLGLEGNFKPLPLDVVVEWRPTLLIVPDVHFEPVEFSGHVRVWF